MAREERADVTVRTHAEQHHVERSPAERPAEVAGIGVGGRVQIGLLGRHAMDVAGSERNTIQKHAPREPVVRIGRIGRHRPLVTPEDLDSRPLDCGADEGGQEGLGDRSARHRDREAPVAGDCAARRGLEALDEPCGEHVRRADDHLRRHHFRVYTRGSDE
jgi:hypothetical protein